MTVWDVNTGKVAAKLTGHGAQVNDAVYSLDGQRIVTAGADSFAMVFKAQDGQRLSRLGRDAVQEDYEPLAESAAAPGAPVTASAARKSSHLFLARLALPGEVKSAAFSADGAQILTVGDDEAVSWDAVAYRPQHWLSSDGTRPIHAAVFAQDGARILMATSYEGPHEGHSSTLSQWSARSGERLKDIELTDWPLQLASVVSDGKNISVVAGSDLVETVVQLRDASSGEVRQTIPLKPEEPIETALLSADGARLLTISKTAVALWDPHKGERLIELADDQTRYRQAAFSPDGQRVITAGEDGTARIHDTKTGAVLLRLVGHGAAVTAVQISRDGKRVVTGGEDATARLWAADTGKSLLIVELPAIPTAVGISPDGTKMLVAAGAAYVYSTRYSDYYAFGCRVLRSIYGSSGGADERVQQALSSCP